MKTIIAAILAIILILSLAACEGEEIPDNSSQPQIEKDASLSDVSEEETPFVPDEPETEEENELSELYEEMLINFGGRDRDGVLGVAKGGGLYYNRNGCGDFSSIPANMAYSFVGFHSDSSNYIQISIPGVFKDAYAFPEEYFEAMVLKYFDTTVEHLRTSEDYYPEQHCYCIGTGGGIGETPALVVNSIDENGDTVVFHLTIDYEYDEDYNMALTVRLYPDGSYKYLSYLPE